jgi:hypothetical protein
MVLGKHINLRPFASLRQFLAWLSFGGCSYIFDCVLVYDVPDVPWIERGVFAGPAFFFTVGWVLFPLVQLIRERIDTQPRG